MKLGKYYIVDSFAEKILNVVLIRETEKCYYFESTISGEFKVRKLPRANGKVLILHKTFRLAKEQLVELRIKAVDEARGYVLKEQDKLNDAKNTKKSISRALWRI